MTKPKTEKKTSKNGKRHAVNADPTQKDVAKAAAVVGGPRRHFLLDQPKAKGKQVGMRVDLDEFAELIEKAKTEGCTSLSNFMRKSVGFAEI